MARQQGRIGAVVTALTVVLLWPSLTLALTDEETFRGFRFNFVPPGARALGMGGAYAAIADDGTASQANPAGLQFILAPEFFLEYGSTQLDTTIDRSTLGSLSVDLSTGARDLPYLGLTTISHPETTGDLGFVGFVFPVRQTVAGRHLRLSGSRQVVLSEDRTLGSGASSTEARFAFPSFPNTVNGSTIEAYSVDTLVGGGSSTDIVFWNVAGSVDVTEDFSAGLTLTYASLDLKSETRTDVIDPLQLFLDPTHPRFPSQPTMDAYRTGARGTDSDVTFTFGLDLHPDSVFASGVSPWRFGAVFHKGARFTVPETTSINGAPGPGYDTTIIVPDRYSISASYRSPVRWLVSLELERVEYSDQLHGFQSGVNYLTGGQVAGGAFGIDPSRSVDFTIEDGFIPRVGLEYLLWSGKGGRSVALWGGYYRTPDDRIRMSQFNSDDATVNVAYMEAFRGGDPTHHVTGGVGLELGPASFHIAGEGSREGHRVVGAFKYRFGAGR